MKPLDRPRLPGPPRLARAALTAASSRPQAPDPQGAVVAEAAAAHEDPGQVQGQLRGVRPWPAGARAPPRPRGARRHLDAAGPHRPALLPTSRLPPVFVTLKLFIGTSREFC